MAYKKYEGFSDAQIAEALKDIQLADNYLVISIRWGEDMVFPYKDGINFMSCMKNMEKLKDDPIPKIVPPEMDIRTKILSREEYITFKMRTLLGINELPAAAA